MVINQHYSYQVTGHTHRHTQTQPFRVKDIYGCTRCKLSSWRWCLWGRRGTQWQRGTPAHSASPALCCSHQGYHPSPWRKGEKSYFGSTWLMITVGLCEKWNLLVCIVNKEGEQTNRAAHEDHPDNSVKKVLSIHKVSDAMNGGLLYCKLLLNMLILYFKQTWRYVLKFWKFMFLYCWRLLK